MKIELTTSVVRVGGVMAEPIQQDLVILNMAGNYYVSLDSLGRRIWEMLEHPIQVDALCHKLENEYAGDPVKIAADLLAFLTELKRDGLVNIAEGAVLS
jgi:hypothetical protein